MPIKHHVLDSRRILRLVHTSANPFQLLEGTAHRSAAPNSGGGGLCGLSHRGEVLVWNQAGGRGGSFVDLPIVGLGENGT